MVHPEMPWREMVGCEQLKGVIEIGLSEVLCKIEPLLSTVSEKP